MSVYFCQTTRRHKEADGILRSTQREHYNTCSTVILTVEGLVKFEVFAVLGSRVRYFCDMYSAGHSFSLRQSLTSGCSHQLPFLRYSLCSLSWLPHNSACSCLIIVHYVCRQNTIQELKVTSLCFSVPKILFTCFSQNRSIANVLTGRLASWSQQADTGACRKEVIATPRDPTPRLHSVWFRAEILSL
jgi:hypothetical protein